MKRFTTVLLLSALALVALSACKKDPTPTPTTVPTPTVAATPTEAAAPTEAALQTLTPGKLTIATGEPAWEPWVFGDAPESGEGFEAAVAYAVAEKLGFSKDDVVWVRTGFDEAIQPGPKTFDFNLQQYSINESRRESVDFSSAYFKEQLVIVANQDNPFAGAKSIADLKDAVFGAAIGDIAVDVTTNVIAPTKEVQVFNDLAAVYVAVKTGQIDVAIVGATNADYVVNIEGEQLPNGTIIGSLKDSEQYSNGLGLLLDKNSPLTAAVTVAVDALVADGTIKAIQEQYLGQYEHPILE